MKISPQEQPGIDPSLVLQPRRKSSFGCLFRLLLLGGLAAAGYFYVIQQQESSKERAQIEYKTEEARIGDIAVTVTATGTLQPTNQVEVGSELSGNIEAVLVDYNDRVKAGQILARLDVSKLKSQVEQTRASLATAKAKVLSAEATIQETTSKLRQLEKIWKLSGGKTPSQFDIDAAKAAAARAKADKASAVAGVDVVQATLRINLNELSKAEIISPVNGIVLSRDIEPGQTVAASLSAPVLFNLAEDLTKMELQVDVDEADIGQVHEGQDALFTVDAYPRRKFSAKIRQVRFASTTTNGVVTYTTVLTVDNKDLALRPGMTATAEIIVQKAEQVLVIPSAALRFNPQAAQAKKERKSSLFDALMPRPRFRRREKQVRQTGKEKEVQQIWCLAANKEPKEITIKTGLSDGINIQVLTGEIKVGDQVITSIVTDRNPQ